MFVQYEQNQRKMVRKLFNLTKNWVLSSCNLMKFGRFEVYALQMYMDD